MARFITLVVVFFVLATAALGTVTALRADEPAAVTRWEYRAIVPREGTNAIPGAESVVVKDFFEAIRRAGGDGWELTAFDAAGGAWLKRPLR